MRSNGGRCYSRILRAGRELGVEIPPQPVMTDRPYSADEEEFIRAMDRYMAATARRFPTWTEALAVLKSLGYRRPEPTIPKGTDTA